MTNKQSDVERVAMDKAMLGHKYAHHWFNSTPHGVLDLAPLINGAIKEGIQTYLAAMPKPSREDVEDVIVSLFKADIQREYPNATVVPSDEHHHIKAKPIAEAVLALWGVE